VVLVLAHRGAHGGALRENTVDAFAAAAAAGADGVELDVRATGDGVLVVLHDPAIEGVGPVAEVAASALPGWVPTLEAALDACAGLALVNVELKADGAPASLAERTAGCLLARPAPPVLLVSSFDLSLLDAHRRAAPGVPTGWLVVPGLDPADLVVRATAGGHAAVHPHFSMVSPELVAVAHAEHLRVAAWTVNDQLEARRLVELGVDVLISDNPAALRRELSGRRKR
jgi:glycerophosphoryl diester phosphodiesterase